MNKARGDDPAQCIMRELSTTMVQKCQPSSIDQGDRGIDITYSTPTLSLTLFLDREYDVVFKKAILQGNNGEIILDNKGTITLNGENYNDVIPRNQDSLRYNEAVGEFQSSLKQLSEEAA